MKKVKYRCKSCGWTKELPAEWADVKPRFCPTPTCEMSVKKSKGKKSFRLTPERLEVVFLDEQVKKQEKTVSQRPIKRQRGRNKDERAGQERQSGEGSSPENSPKED